MARPSIPLLSRDRIRDSALELVDRNGLDALSMRAIAGELGVQASSLYGHFATKEEVLDAIANLLTRSVDTSGFAEGWQQGLLVWGRSYRASLLEHPNAAPLVAAGAGRREDFLAMSDRVHGGLLAAGWTPRLATEVAAGIKYLVIGSATTPFASGFADDTAVYLNRYPNLVQAHRIRQHAERIDRESFELALASLVAGYVPVHAALAESSGG